MQVAAELKMFRGAKKRREWESASSADSPRYTLPTPTLREVLRRDVRLVKYAGDFEAAELTVELAARLSIGDLHLLLPAAPLGHCVRLQQLFEEAAQPVVAGTRAARQMLPTRLLSHGADAVGAMQTAYEMQLIMSTLLMPAAVALATTCQLFARGPPCYCMPPQSYARHPAVPAAHKGLSHTRGQK